MFGLIALLSLSFLGREGEGRRGMVGDTLRGFFKSDMDVVKVVIVVVV